MTGIVPREFWTYVIVPTLARIGHPFDTASAGMLILGTGLAESGLRHLRQLNGGPARGPLQIEPLTAWDMVERVIAAEPALMHGVETFAAPFIDRDDLADQLHWNLALGVVIARAKYWSDPHRLPGPDDFEGLANYWKRVYNTSAGTGRASYFHHVLRAATQGDVW